MKSDRCSITPRENFVVIQRYEQAQLTPGGIVIPDTQRIKMDTGKVLAIGPGKYGDSGQLIPISGIYVGDTVHFAANAGTNVEISGQSYYLIPSVNIIAVECK